MNQADVLNQLYGDLGKDPKTASLVSLTTIKDKIEGVEQIKEKLATLNVQAGWITYPSKVETITSPCLLNPSQPPIEAELVTNDCTIRIRHLGDNQWQWIEHTIKTCEAESNDVTHLATDYEESLKNSKTGSLHYKRLWAFSNDKGMYIDVAVLDSIKDGE